VSKRFGGVLVNTDLKHRPATSYATTTRSRLRLTHSDLRFADLMRIRLLARRTQGNTKAADAELRRIGPAPVGRPTILGGDFAPTAATAHAERSRCRTTRVRHATTRVISIPLLTPLPNVAMHVVKASRIRFFAAHGMGTDSFKVLMAPNVVT